MARMHARKRGSSGSKKPLRYKPPKWVRLNEKKIRAKILEMAKAGYSSAKIGTLLRDQYGIPSTKLVLDKKIVKILEEEGFQYEIPEDLTNLLKKAIRLNTHVENNSRDKTNRRGLQLVEAKIRRLVRYYKKKDRLPESWSYSIEQAKLIVD